MLLADESVNENLIIAMRSKGYDVFSVREEMRSESDINIANFSLEPLRIIVTEDKDFGEIVYHYNLKVAGVILLRYSPLDYSVIENKLLNYLTAHLNNSVGKFIVITPKLTRIRTLPL
jgi:predicted nuclease of predicted toxin-antitoxin system